MQRLSFWVWLSLFLVTACGQFEAKPGVRNNQSGGVSSSVLLGSWTSNCYPTNANVPNGPEQASQYTFNSNSTLEIQTLSCNSNAPTAMIINTATLGFYIDGAAPSNVPNGNRIHYWNPATSTTTYDVFSVQGGTLLFTAAPTTSPVAVPVLSNAVAYTRTTQGIVQTTTGH